MNERPLWECPKCGRGFANRNQSHACGIHTLEHHFLGKPRGIRTLFRQVVAVVRSVGPKLASAIHTHLAQPAAALSDAS